MDLIDRQAAIDFINAGHLVNPNEPRWSDNEVVNFLKSMPPVSPDLSGYSKKLWKAAYERGKAEAQPERKKGFWYALEKGDKGYSAGDFKCSVCGEPNHTWIPKPNFCPNCGADCRGEQDEDRSD